MMLIPLVDLNADYRSIRPIWMLLIHRLDPKEQINCVVEKVRGPFDVH